MKKRVISTFIVAAFLFLTQTVSAAEQTYGYGFLSPDTGKLGAGNIRVDLVDVLVAATFSYGITDYVDVEIGDYLFVIGNIGFRFHSPTFGKNFDFTLLTKAFFLPANTGIAESKNVQIGTVGIAVFSYNAGWIKISASAGYCFINNYQDAAGGGLILLMKARKKISFITEFSGFAMFGEGRSVFAAMGIFAGPRFRISQGVVDAGLLFPFIKDHDSSNFSFPVVLPMLNFHLLF